MTEMATENMMVEQVARALHKHFGKPKPGVVEPLIPWDSLEPKHKSYWNDAARAAIEAYEATLRESGLVVVPREPTKAMREELWELYLNRETLDEDWQRMIDAALQTQEKGE